MGFKLTKSHHLDHRKKTINYYTLGNFGVYEETTPVVKPDSGKSKNQKFLSWTPWGDGLEINSVKELSKAYEEFTNYNPEIAMN